MKTSLNGSNNFDFDFNFSPSVFVSTWTACRSINWNRGVSCFLSDVRKREIDEVARTRDVWIFKNVFIVRNVPTMKKFLRNVDKIDIHFWEKKLIILFSGYCIALSWWNSYNYVYSILFKNIIEIIKRTFFSYSIFTVKSTIFYLWWNIVDISNCYI